LSTLLNHIRDLERIRRYLPLSVENKLIATALVTSGQDDCDSFFFTILQRVQNC